MSSTDDDASGITAKLASTSIGDRGDGTKAGTNGGANVNGIAHAHSNDHANSNELSFAKGGQNGSGAQATQPPTPPAVADVVSDKYYKAFLIKLFEFGRAAESGVDVVDKWEAVRSLDPIAISQSLRAQAQKKPTEARTVPSGQERKVMIQPGLVQNGAGDGYKRDSHGNVIGPLAGLPASRNGARRDGAAAGVNGKAASTTTTTGMNGQFAAYPQPSGPASASASGSPFPAPSTQQAIGASSTTHSHAITPIASGQPPQPVPRAPARPTSPNGSSSKGPLWGQDLSLSPDRLALWRAHVACMPPSCPSYTFTLPGISFPTHDTAQIQKAQDWMERLRVRVNDMRNIFTSKRAMHLLTLVGGDEADAKNCLGLTTTKGDKVLLETRQVLIHGRMALLSLGKKGNVDERGSVRVNLWRAVLEFDKKGRLVNGAAGNGDGKEQGDANGPGIGPGAGNGAGYGRVVQRCEEMAGRTGGDEDVKVNCSVGIMRIQGGHPIVFSLHHLTLKARAYPVSGNKDEEAKAVKALRYLVDNGSCCSDCKHRQEWSYEVTPLWIPERPEDGHTLTTHILQNIIVQTSTHESGIDPRAYGLTKDNRTLPSRQAAWLAWQQTGLRVANFEALKRESDRLGILST